MEKDYFLGLDMGTGSLGWAVTDDKYEILRAHGKALWGVRLFETAETAEERRINRTSRRRNGREKWRISVLQELFAEEINKVDPGFYLRMKESKYWPEDKRNADGNCPELPYALFVDKDYTDKDYHKEFPTIYHLRKMLMDTETMPDIRLVYLAIHHMMKHRGHFLLSGDIESIKAFGNVFEQLVKSLKDEELQFNLEFDEESVAKTEEILRNRQLVKSEKKKQLIKLLNAKSKCEKAVLTLLTGGKAKLSDVFGNEELDSTEKPSISFSDSTYDDYEGTVAADLAEQFVIIENIKAVYDWSVLADILGRHTSLSEAKIELFDKHKEDLKLLKDVVKTYLTPQDYQDIFVSPDKKFSNYPAYIGMTKVNGRKEPLEGKRCLREDFYKLIKARLKIGKPDSPVGDIEKLNYIQNEIEKETFLPLQVNKDNSVLPYQVHYYELKKILSNLEDKSTFIKENKEKILQLFTFRIPYYVGPLNVVKDPAKSPYTWAKRKSDDKIYPWNFEEVIDVEESAERFIRRMTNKCTYLYGEDVLPKDSLLYSKFMVLNELNNIRLNGDKPSVEVKQKIFTDLFQKYRKVTVKRLTNYLVKEGIVDKGVEITGIDGDFKGSLSSYHDLKQKLTDVTLSPEQMEEVILNVVLFGDDKTLLRQRLTKLFPELTEGQKKSICTLSYSGWGRLSGAFLNGIAIPKPETGEVWTIIDALWDTNENLMQLLSDKYGFAEEVKKHNVSDEKPELSYKTVEQLYASPAVKRQIWQTLKVVKEIKKIMGGEPKRIFVEMAREKQQSNRTVSRKTRLLDLYKSCKKEERDWLGELGAYDENQLRSDKLYLYYTQKGRCMYTGEPISLEDLWDNNKYDIDHIYPQSKVMDDSLVNRVLVKKVSNEEKADIYPLKPEIRQKMGQYWKSLLDGKFIEKEKYERLARTTEFGPDELAGFIARQLVETRQSTKLVAEILKQAFPDSEIVYTKAKIVSKFRKDFDLIKVRDLNDLHHAKDAYLNIVVGNTYFVKFTKDAAWFIRNNPGRSYSLNQMFTSKYDVERNGEVAWKAGKGGTIATVKRVMGKNNILVTRKSYIVTGGLFDQQIMKKGKGQIPIKGSDDRLTELNKYGGYNKAAGAYFMLVESEGKKGKLVRTIVDVPLYLRTVIENDEQERIRFLVEDKGMKNPRVLIKCIKKDTLFKINGFPLYLSGRTGKQLIFKGASQFVMPKKQVIILKRVLKYVQAAKEKKVESITKYDRIENEDLVGLYDTFGAKLKNTIFHKRPNNQENTIETGREKFLTLSLEDKCIVLSEMLHLFQCKSGAANLEFIGGTVGGGLIKLGNEITSNEQISIYYQSPTGVYEQEIDLKTV